MNIYQIKKKYPVGTRFERKIRIISTERFVLTKNGKLKISEYRIEDGVIIVVLLSILEEEIQTIYEINNFFEDINKNELIPIK